MTSPVTFLWPFMLVSLLVIPVIVFLYVRIQRRRTRASGFFGASGGQRAGPSAGRQAPGFRRHLPPIFFLLGLAVVLVALARPQAEVALPRVEGTVMLVFDVSASMGATDVQPSRLEAAKAAAREFVLSQPSTVRIGIVSFSGSGFTVQSPTNDTSSLLATINRLQPTKGTSLGSGIATALNAIAVDAGLASNQSTTADASTGGALTGGPSIATQPPGQNAQPSGQPQQELLAQLPAGKYPSSEIVLLSDGEDNQGIDPAQAAKAAADHGVKVDALGFGTTAGATITVDGYRVHTALDEATLQQITQVAGGTYYPAQGNTDPKQVYASLTPQVVIRPEFMEITAIFAGASIVLLLVGSLFSIVWFRRPV